MNDIQLDGDPRRLATTIYRAALESYKQKHGDPQEEIDRLHGNLENEVPVLARQMVEALEPDIRDVYLMNAFELMALDYARRDFPSSS
ncbi:MAG: hypothetical protein CME26_02310 [Gemmatimonadetes bacterium]|nr:hypothetical protein [Gemmatimonadota bacterium]|tara:strand:- start:3218 stop:3481 length:264 start_codon:yes stop_codon:yes gene_type:complete